MSLGTLRSGLAAALFAATLPLSGAPPEPPAPPGPRPLSQAEREAVSWALGYLVHGPPAFVEVLSGLSPLGRLDPADAQREIEVRAGPPRGARWELRTVVPSLEDRVVAFSVGLPSGMDETLLLHVAREGERFRLRSLEILSEPSSFALGSGPPAVVEPPGPSAAEEGRTTPLLVLAGALLLSGTALLVAAVLKREPVARATFAVCGAALLATAWFGLRRLEMSASRKPDEPEASAAWRSGAALRELLPLRRALATGSFAEADGILSRLPARGPAAEVGRLWKAQRALSEMDLPQAERLLATFPAPSPIPLAEILRARLLALRSREAEAAVAYERAINLGPGQDGLWWEAAQAFRLLGFEERAKVFLRRLARIGTREAGAYYALAAQEAREKRPERGEPLFRLGWSLAPVSRADLFDDPLLWSVASRPAIYPSLLLDQEGEPAYASLSPRTAPLDLPAGAVARLTAGLLRIAVDETELVVPGGVVLAPPGLAPTDAAAEQRDEEQRALANLKRLTAAARSAGALTQPLLRRQVAAAVSGLVAANRWGELAALTAGISPGSDAVPVEILFRRAEALRRTGHLDEARAFLAELSNSTVLLRRATPVVLFSLAELLVSVDRYDEAIRLLERVAVAVPYAGVDDRLRQVRMEKRLAAANEVLRTDHFDVVYPSERSVGFARQMGDLLEAERQRLLPLVPLTGESRRVTVHLLSWEDFATTWASAPGVVGLYDGKIRLPLGGMRSLVPELVALVTHELAHAMLDEATAGRAPRWLQEGLAQHAEMTRFRSNPIPEYVARGRFLSLTALDEALRSLPDRATAEQAYLEAFWWVVFVDRTAGRSALHRLLWAFRDGAATTEEGVRQAFGEPLSAFHGRFRAWSVGSAPKVWTVDVLRYDLAEPGAVRSLPVATPPRKKKDVPDSLKPPSDEW